jgi:6-phosphogluconolactonase/glucosamine-6-phosphate isomerase/deaminase
LNRFEGINNIHYSINIKSVSSRRGFRSLIFNDNETTCETPTLKKIITMGVGITLKARRIILLVWDECKADILKQAEEGW